MHEGHDQHRAGARIEALWEQFLPLVRTRVTLIEGYLAGDGSDVVDVVRAAHNLAGALGSYGRIEGSVAARRIEQALRAGDAESLARARDDVVRIRAVVEG